MCVPQPRLLRLITLVPCNNLPALIDLYIAHDCTADTEIANECALLSRAKVDCISPVLQPQLWLSTLDSWL